MRHVIHRKAWYLLALALLAQGLVASILAQQEKPSPTSDYQYKKDYAEVEGIMKETDADQRATKLTAFVKEHPQSRMIPYVWGYYQQILAEKEKAGAWDKVFSLHDQWIQLRADDTGAQKSLAAAYYRGKKLDKAAEMTEKLYAASKDKAMLGDLLAMYQQLNNAEKYAATADLVIKEYPIEQSFGTAVQMAQIYAAKNDVAKASDYASKVLAAFGDKTPQGVDEKAWNTTRVQLYSIVGANEYAKKDCARAVENYEKAAKIDVKNDIAHYQIAMCKWRSQDLDAAMASFARAVVLGKGTSKKAQEYLEQIYKPRHPEDAKLEGLDQLKAKAKSEVGAS